MFTLRGVQTIHRSTPLPSPTSGGRSVGIVRSRTKAMELLLLWNIRIVFHTLYNQKLQDSLGLFVTEECY
jgi:hypothetical protein